MKNETNITQISIIPWNFLALCLSYSVNKSILWCLLHAICGAFYVAYWLFSYTDIANWINGFVVV